MSAPIVILFFFALAGRAEHAPPASTPATARPEGGKVEKGACHAVEKAMGRIQSSVAHLKSLEKDCFTCHHNTMTMETFAAARRNGIIGAPELAAFKAANLDVLKKDLPAERIRDHIRFLKLDRMRGKGELFDLAKRSSDPELNSLDRQAFDNLDDIHGSAATISSALTALRIGGEPTDERAREMVRYLTETQDADGHWEPSEKRRVPSEGSAFQLTVNSLNAIAHYGDLPKNAHNQAAFASGMKWLLSPPTPPADTQDRATYLSGLIDLRDAKSVGAGDRRKIEAIIAREKTTLLEDQRNDGGWRQTADRSSDSYATGLVLAALSKAGEPPDSKPYRRGVAYLLGKQDSNGDWVVPSRVDAQFETLYLIDDPAPGNVTADDLARARPFQKKHRDQDDEHRGGLNKARNDPRRSAEVDAHHRVHSQFISFMATNLAAQALIPACAAESKKP